MLLCLECRHLLSCRLFGLAVVRLVGVLGILQWWIAVAFPNNLTALMWRLAMRRLLHQRISAMQHRLLSCRLCVGLVEYVGFVLGYMWQRHTYTHALSVAGVVWRCLR